MKKMRKFLAVVAAGTLMAAMLAGCGSEADDKAGSAGSGVNAEISDGDADTKPDDAGSDTAADDGAGAGTAADDGAGAGTAADDGAGDKPNTEFTTVSEGVLTMATNAYFPPYEYYEGNEIVGIDVEIAEAIAAKLGLELKIEDMEFDSILIAVQQGKADMGLAGMSVTPDRLKSVNFTDTYATGIQVVIVTEDSDIQGIDDLDGKKVGVQLGTTGDTLVKESLGEDSVDQYNKGADAVMALKQGKVDAVIIDNQPALSYVKSTEGLKILETEFAVEDYAAAIAKENDGLVAAVNDAVAQLKEDGTIQSILDKYIKADE